MAETAAHVTMLQRSPTYIVSLPAEDKISAVLRKVLPEKAVYKLARGRNIGIQRGHLRPGPAPPEAGAQDRAGRRQARSSAGNFDMEQLHPEVRPVGPAAVRHPRR